MARIVGRRPVEIKISTQLDGYVPVFNGSTRLWEAVNKNDFITSSATISGSNIFTGNQTISGSLTVYQGITGSLFGTASYADNAWAIGGNSFSGGDSSRILGTLSDHHLSIYTSGSRVATFTNSGSLFVASYLPNNLNNDKFLVDAGVTTSPNLIQALSDINSYSQINIQNFNTGSNASSDVIATANNGSEIGYYIDMGINSSTFSGSIGTANDAYLYSTGNDLLIGNATNNPIQFFAGGTNTDTNRKLQLNPNNLHQMTGSLDISGSVVARSFTGSLQGSSSYALTSSYADNFTVAGTLTAQTIVAQTITSSVEFITGSTQFGSLLSDTHQFTGSVSVTGSLEINGRNYINDSSSFESRILTNSSSFASFSGSYINESSSFASRITTNSSSFTNFSGSYVTESSSFAGRITTNSSSFALFSGSYVSESSSFASRITTNSSSFATFSGSYVTESSSFADRITTNSASISSLSSSFATFSGSFNTGSFTGSFTGSLLGTASYAAQALTASNANTASSADDFTVRGTLTAQKIVAQTITSSTEFITGSTKNGSLLTNTHQFTGSVGITGSLNVNGSDYITTSGSASTRLTSLETFSGSYSTGSFTGSFIGRVTGSFSGSLYNLQNSVLGHIPFFSSSQVLADSVVRQLDNGSGSYSIVINQDNITTAAPEALYVYQPSATSYNVIAGKGNLNNYLQLNIQNTNTGISASSDVVATANNGNETTNYIDMGINSEGFTGLVGDANDAYLYSTGNDLHIGNASNFPIQFFAGGLDNNANKKFQLNPNNSHQMTGSLDVSGSIVAHSFTGSLQGTASVAVSASFATSASYAVNATTASYVLNAVSSSFATSASYAVTASLANNAINASTASYVQNAQTASYVLQAVSASYATSASFVAGISDGTASIANTASHAISASYAATASSADNFLVRGTLTAQTINVQTITSSIDFVTGSSRFGSTTDNTHQFTGSVSISGSLVVNNSPVILTNQTSSMSVLTASYALQTGKEAIVTSPGGIYYIDGVAKPVLTLTPGKTYRFNTSNVDVSHPFKFSLSPNGPTQYTYGVTSGSGYIEINVDYNTSSSLYYYCTIHNGMGNAVNTLRDENLIHNSQTSSMSVASASFATTASYVLQAVSASFATTASYALISTEPITVTSPGGIYYINGVANPVLTFIPGQNYRFDTSNVDISHPFKFSLSPNGPTQYTYGVTSGSGFIEINVDYNTSSSLYYYCTIHNGMGNAANTLRDENLIHNSQTSSMSVASASYAATASFVAGISDGTASMANTASYAVNADLLDGKDSTIFATTGSNVFIGNQIITGSFAVSGSTIQIGNNTLLGNTTLTGSITVSGPLRLDPTLDPGQISTTSSFLFTSASNTATGYDLYYRQGDNKVKFKWIEGVLNTGILYGGVLTYSASNFYISSGSGIIVNHNATTGSEISPTITYVNWAASTHSIANPSDQNTYVFIDANGDLQQQNVFFTPEQYHDTLPIGRISHYGATGSLVTGVGNNILTSYDLSQQLGQFTRAFGPLKMSGFTITPQVGNLSLNIGSGTAYNLGGYYQNTPDLPSTYNSNTYLTSSIIRLYRSGSGFQFDNNGGAYYTTVNPLVYDDGTGTLATVGNGNWSIQRVFVNPITGRSHVYYGQSTYTSYLNAVQSVATDDFVESEITKNAYVFAGYLVMQGGAANTDLSVGGSTNAIIQAGLFRNSVGGSGGATTAVSDLNDLSDVNISSPSNGQALIYSTGTWINGTPISSSYAATASFVANAQTASYVANAQTASYVQTAQTASYVENAQTASYVLNAISASYAATASSADNFTVRGTLTAQTINVQTITSSIEFNTGSTRNGSTTANTHEFTGSVSVSGSLAVNGSNTILTNQTSSMSVATASYVETAQTASYVLNAQSASYWSGSIINAETASYILQAVSASYANNADLALTSSYAYNATSASYALTASYISGSAGVGFPFSGSAIITGSFLVSQSFVDFTQATYVTGSFTGSFSGTASNAVSSSFATSALTASYTPNAIVTASVNISTITFTKGDNSTFNITVAQSGSVESSSFAINATSASHALNANTASFAFSAISSSFASNSNTASFALNANTASFAQTSSYSSYAVYAGNSPGSTSTMTQSIAATTWSFTHNLNTRNPLLQVYDSTNSQIIPFAVIGSDPNQATIYFDVAESGYAVASNGGLLTVNGSTARLDQTTSAVTWSFQHNLATKYPNFIIYDSTDNVVIPAGIHAVNDMTAEIYFAFPSTGVAIANFSGISGSVNVATASYAINATTASYAYDFNVAHQLTIDQTLTDYHTVPSSIVGSNNMFTRVTGSYSSAFFKYSVTKGSNSRAGEVIAAWAGGTLQFTDNSTLDVGDTSGVVATAIIAASSVQFNITTADSAWTLKTLATFM